MWRVWVLMLFVLPPAAIALNHEVISFLLILLWTAGAVPVCILQAVDFVRSGRAETKRARIVGGVLRAGIGFLGALSCLMGASIIAWCIYNLCVRRLPGYFGPTNAVELLMGGFGIAPILCRFGWYLLQLASGFARNHDQFGG